MVLSEWHRGRLGCYELEAYSGSKELDEWQIPLMLKICFLVGGLDYWSLSV